MPSVKSKRKELVIIVISVLAVAAIALIVSISRQVPQVAREPSPAQQKSVPIRAPQGQLPQGFPPDLILDQQAKLSLGYTINYDKNLNQYTASYESQEQMSSLFSQYKDYLKQNGWTITNEVTTYQASRGLYASKGNIELSVAIVNQNKSRVVVVNYLVK